MTIIQGLSLLVLVFVLEALFYNVLYPNRLPYIPGDIHLEKSKFPVYIPFASAIVITVALTFLIGMLKG